jgi:hypothetical protein
MPFPVGPRPAAAFVHRLTPIATLALAAFAPALHAQRPTRDPAIPAAMALVREADLKRDLYAMASQAMRGREGGSLDEMPASTWVADMYREIGLKTVPALGSYYQWFNVTRTRVSVAASRITIGGTPLAPFRDIIPLGAVPAAGQGAVLWLADASDTTIDIRGRIVATTVVTPAPASIRPTSYPFPNRYADAAILATTSRLTRRGAAAILLVADARVDSAFASIASMRDRGSYDVDHAMPRGAGPAARVGPLPTLGSGPSPTYLVRAAMAATLMRAPAAEIDVRLERFDVPSVNVIGMVRGTDPTLRDEYVVFSSHQDANGVRVTVEGDSVFAGADDNGSVSVALFAAARAFVRQPGKRSVLFIHHGAEERGLLGSRYHVANPVVPLGSLIAVLNGDMIGRNHPDSASLLGAQPPHRSSSDLVEMALRANALTGKFTLDSLWDRPTHPEGWFFRSDHVPYARVNIPSLMYSTNLHDDYHTPRDTPERIDYAKLTRMARWMYLTGWFVANAPARPRVDAGYRLER